MKKIPHQITSGRSSLDANTDDSCESSKIVANVVTRTRIAISVSVNIFNAEIMPKIIIHMHYHSFQSILANTIEQR